MSTNPTYTTCCGSAFTETTGDDGDALVCDECGAHDEALAAERRIVEWLREHPDHIAETRAYRAQLASAIERGEHRG